MNSLHNLTKNEDGFVLITAMVMLVILTLLGTFALNTTRFELQVAGNDRRYKEAFFLAEAGTAVGVELLEQNLYCADQGFTVDGNISGVNVSELEGTIRVYERNGNGLAFYTNFFPPVTNIGDTTQADAAFPIANLAANAETTHLYIGGSIHMGPGGSLVDNAGYERKGKGAAGGGVYKIYDIYSQYSGLFNTESIVLLGWRHPLDLVGDCNY